MASGTGSRCVSGTTTGDAIEVVSGSVGVGVGGVTVEDDVVAVGGTLAGGTAVGDPAGRSQNQARLPANIITPLHISSTAHAPNQRQRREGFFGSFIVGNDYPAIVASVNIEQRLKSALTQETHGNRLVPPVKAHRNSKVRSDRRSPKMRNVFKTHCFVTLSTPNFGRWRNGTARAVF